MERRYAVEIITSLLTALGANGILLFLIQRYFKRRDQRISIHAPREGGDPSGMSTHPPL